MNDSELLKQIAENQQKQLQIQQQALETQKNR